MTERGGENRLGSISHCSALPINSFFNNGTSQCPTLLGMNHVVIAIIQYCLEQQLFLLEYYFLLLAFSFLQYQYDRCFHFFFFFCNEYHQLKFKKTYLLSWKSQFLEQIVWKHVLILMNKKWSIMWLDTVHYYGYLVKFYDWLH